MTDLRCPNCGASASLPIGRTCDDHQPVPIDPVVEIAERELAAEHRAAINRWLGLPSSPDTENSDKENRHG